MCGQVILMWVEISKALESTVGKNNSTSIETEIMKYNLNVKFQYCFFLTVLFKDKTYKTSIC